jgi:hypothetical protein
MGTFPISLCILQPLQVLSEALGRFPSLNGRTDGPACPPPTAEGTSAVATDAIISGFTGYLTVRADNSLVEDFL